VLDQTSEATAQSARPEQTTGTRKRRGRRPSLRTMAYALSAVAAAVYVVAAIALRTGKRALLAGAASVELAGVLAVGLLTLADASAFPDETVWSNFGEGYAFLPLLLPVAALAWLRLGRVNRERRLAADRGGARPTGPASSPRG